MNNSYIPFILYVSTILVVLNFGVLFTFKIINKIYGMNFCDLCDKEITEETNKRYKYCYKKNEFKLVNKIKVDQCDHGKKLSEVCQECIQNY